MTMGRAPVRVIWEQGKPRRFWWRRRWRHVLRVQEMWVDAGAWWKGETPCWFYRVATDDGVYELVRQEGDWSHSWLYRVYD
jgi:hypothetical protein